MALEALKQNCESATALQSSAAYGEEAGPINSRFAADVSTESESGGGGGENSVLSEVTSQIQERFKDVGSMLKTLSENLRAAPCPRRIWNEVYQSTVENYVTTLLSPLLELAVKQGLVEPLGEFEAAARQKVAGNLSMQMADQWTELPPMYEARQEFAVVVLPCGRVLVAGGKKIHQARQSSDVGAVEREDNPLDPATSDDEDAATVVTALVSAELFCPATNSWQQLPDMPTECQGSSVGGILDDGHIVIYACREASVFSFHRRVGCVLDLASFTWESLESVVPADWAASLSHFRIGRQNDALFLMHGGWIAASGTKDQAWEYDEPTLEWKQVNICRKCVRSIDFGCECEAELLCDSELLDSETGKIFWLPGCLAHGRKESLGVVLPVLH